MQLTLIKKNQIFSSVLPEKKNGQYWVTDLNHEGTEERVTSVEGFEGRWILKSNRNVEIYGEKAAKVKEIILEPLSFYNIYLKNSGEKVLLYSEPVTEDRGRFDKFLLPEKGQILIGRAKDCDIVYSNIFTSSTHAELTVDGESIFIKDLDSSNGTFVNGIRVKQGSLKVGDFIYIMGLKLIIGSGFIAVNNPDGERICREDILKKFMIQKVEDTEEEQSVSFDVEREDVFYRSPRFKRDIKKSEIKISPPPPLSGLEETPLMLMLGPSITMGLTSLFTGLLTLQGVLRTNGDIVTAMPTLMMSFSMLLGTILWPLLTKRHEKKKRIAKEKDRQESYKNYLNELRNYIAEEAQHQSVILNENFISADKCAERIKDRQRNLWERSPGQKDFLEVHVGTGNLPMEIEMKYPEKSFTVDKDSLLEEMYKLVAEPKLLEKVPVTLSLQQHWVSGIIGNRDLVRDFVKALILQLTTLHSYDELKLVFLYDKKESESWEFVKWLPHVWNNDKSLRFLASDEREVKELSAYLEKEIQKREVITSEEDLKEVKPHYVLFSMSRELAGKAEIINLVLKQKRNHGFSIIPLYDELRHLPKECMRIVELSESASKIYDKNDITGEHITFTPSFYSKLNMEKLSISLSNIELQSSTAEYTLPGMITFLEMFGVGKVQHLNSLTRWKENNPTVSIETPIGVDTSGEIFKLDLHEKFHGPHGLIAGMTGSGKSEVIMTFILSLAVNYHPDEVAFILIDYKGGGMANAFSKLPHLAGTITNLDGTAVKRSLISIQSELKRRQAIFSETSKHVNISNIDIYKYQKLYREGTVKEPLQHLFIISDEFAELKTQQPEFMEQLVSAARIGRSLGIHLILATQKPAGVVDDQVWSNSKFRICLKVQEKADSMDVIKRSDAAELSVTGRFFLQVGFNELFVLGQSAWSGAPYYPKEQMEESKDNSILVVDNLGRVLSQAKKDKYKNLFNNPSKQVDEVNRYLSKLAEEEGIKVRPLWLEPIPEAIYSKELKSKYGVEKQSIGILNPVIGEVDDPARQRQFVLTLPITQEGNTVVYGAAGSGKTTFLTTTIHSLLEDHTASELNLYILDFASETLRAFSEAPQVGDVLLSHESEKINNLFKMLYGEIERRKKLFYDYGGDYNSFITSSDKVLESIVVVIHNYSAFTEIYEDKEEAMAFLTREGLKYGIYFIITALSTGALRYKILQNFKQLFVLQLNDNTEYSGVLGNVDGVYPSKFKGRGIFKTDAVYEFQTAKVTKNVDNVFGYIRNYCREQSEKWKQPSAKKVPILPDRIDADYLKNEIAYSPIYKIPIGIEKHSLNTAYYNLDDYYVNLVLSERNGNADFIQGIAEVMAMKSDLELLVLDPHRKFSAVETAIYKYKASETELDEGVVELFNILVFRNNTYKEAVERGEKPPVFKPMTCIINSIINLNNLLSEDRKDKLKLILEKGELHYNVRFIICDSSSAMSTVTYENWFRTKASLSNAIWIGNGIGNQYVLKITDSSNQVYADIGEEFGYIIGKGRLKLIKLLSSITSKRESELHE